MESDSHSNKIRGWVLVLLGVILIIVAIVLAILSLLSGNSTGSSTGGIVDTTQSLTCTSEEIAYPPSGQNDSTGKAIKIIATFDDSKLDTISLTYRVAYESESSANQGATDLRIAVNKNFAEDSLGVDSLGITYSTIKNVAQLNLYAKAKEINSTSEKYFMLDGANGSFKQDNLAKIYSDKGFNCTVNK